MRKNAKTVCLALTLMGVSLLTGEGMAYAAGSKVVARANSAQQQAECKGVVKDAKGEAIIGASVVVKGSTNGAVTNIDGAFALKAKQGDVLQISCMGYVPQTIKWNGQALNVTLNEDNSLLDEVVVVGYGSQKKVNLTGSVATVDSRQLESRPIQNLQNGLQGMMPGVAISGTNGAPGQDAGTINVRGVGTFNTSTPYILVDGVETGTMSSIDPSDVESISVLKDAASAAIYGSKAANGVILITTKKGKTGKPKVTYSGYVSAQNATALVDRLSSYDYASMLNDALVSEGKAARFTDEELQKFKDGSDPNYPNTDWYDLAYKTGVMTHHNVNVNGATDNVSYMASVGYLKQTGILENAGREQFNGRTNLEMKINKRLTARLNLAFIKNNYSDASSAYYGGSSDQLVRQLNLVAPWIVARYDDGTWGTVSDGSPIAWLDNGLKVNRKNTNFTGLFGLTYQIIDGLKISANASYVNNNQNYNYFQKYFEYNANKKTSTNFLDDRVYKWERSTFEALLNYDKSFGQHNLSALAGYHAEAYDYKYWYTYRQDFPNNSVTDMNAGTTSTQKNNGYTRDLNMLSWFGRINYDFAGRYLFEANLRADASSRFADGHRWGYFPSFSAGWRVSEEAFMESTKSWLSNLKLRASWGQLGNQEALDDYYPSMNTYNLGAAYVFDGALSSGYYQSSYKINTITWEKATTWGIGLDMGFLNNKITASIDYYNRLTDGILMEVDAPNEFALGSYTDNVGKMRNQGVELSIAYNDKFGDVQFGAAFNIAYNKNEIVEMPGKGYNDTGTYQRNAKGHEYNSYYVYQTDGFFSSDEEAQAYMKKYWPDGNRPFSGGEFKAGDLRYVDTNGDGTIDETDRVFVGSSTPRYTFGLNLNAAWKGFDLTMFFNGQIKAYRYFDAYEVQGAFVGDATHPATIWKDSWTYNKSNPKMPRIFTENNSPSASRNVGSDFWLANVSYLRMKNLQIGYTLPKTLVQSIGIENVRFYYSCENLFTIDNLDINVDPEATSQRLSSYPLLRTHSVGVNVTF